jgi:hypothetical protein
MQQSFEPHLITEPKLKDDPTTAERAAFQKKYDDWLPLKAAYDKQMLVWEEQQRRGCSAIKNRCGYNNWKKVETLNRVYQMLDTLRLGRSTGAGKLIDLTTRFYALTLAECKNISDFSNQLSQINNELKDLHESVAFTSVQLILRFLQGLGSAYEIFITTFQQTHNLIQTPGNPAVDWDTVVQKAFDEEQRQSSSATSAGAAFMANSRPSNARDFCDHCKKPYHTEAKCFLKHPHLKKDFDTKRKGRNNKRKSDGAGESSSKKPKSSTESTPSSAPSADPTDTATVMVHNFQFLAIDSQPAGTLAPSSAIISSPLEVALLAPAGSLKDDWIVDTGCTNHASADQSQFINFRLGDFGSCGGVGGQVKFEGIGDIPISIPGPNGQPAVLTLTNVKWCPSMGPYNLISVSQLFKSKKFHPQLHENSISWMAGKHKINATARNGLWLLDRAE